MDVKDGLVVKGVRFRNHKVVGDILQLAERYSNQGADELVFYDITASPEDRSVDRSWVNRVAEKINIPFCVAGGIRSIGDAEEVLNYGADKISINTPAINNPDLIDELAKRFGTQCIVIGIDSFEDGNNYKVFSNTGDPSKSSDTGLFVNDWIKEVQERGAGEIENRDQVPRKRAKANHSASQSPTYRYDSKRGSRTKRFSHSHPRNRESARRRGAPRVPANRHSR